MSNVIKLLLSALPFVKELIFQDQSIKDTLRRNKTHSVIFGLFLIVALSALVMSSLLVDEKIKSNHIAPTVDVCPNCSPYDKAKTIELLEQMKNE